ncbi:right-handed parallel beta-helix repeat-containing protein [Pedobacter puniceum]|uniref:Right handed beta helix domain-containing protein n=1 Tax=Pedobacter puniceum TaxID=2666136 RepID=A0A7K0FLR8_9SPHI|nr:right-handed parallel beta-helix repeat-containing protein [Pedobacter puniceum]MRX46909.1 hypothetical protein [Pedobacter puniceum]
MMKKLLFAIAYLFICFNSSYARNFYFSASGNDKANGKSPKTAWKSLNKLKNFKLQPGDTLFFKRGDIFTGTLDIQQSGTRNHPIVITAFGKGVNPLFLGSITVKDWKSIGNNKYEASLNQKVFDIYEKNYRFTPARYPNSGFLKVEKGFGKDSLSSLSLQEPEDYWNGATLRIRTIDWVYETRSVKKFKNTLIEQGKQDRYPIDRSFLDRTINGSIPVYNFRKGYGFFLEGLPNMVDSTYEWSWSNNKILLQMPKEKQPKAIRAVVYDYGLFIADNVKYVKIKDINFQQYEKAGIRGGRHLSHIQILNNQFQNIHQNGIELDSASSHCSIEGNYIKDILGRGISALEPYKLEISDNTIRRIGLVRGHGFTGVNGATGILIHNNERKKSTDSTYANHNLVRYNRIDSCGYNGIRVDGNNNILEYNVIDYCSLTLNDGANIYCYGSDPRATHHSIFRNNIVRYSVGDSEATPNNPNLAFGIYLDNNTNHVLVENNTVIKTGAAGMVNNDASFKNSFIGNNVFNCQEGLGYAEWAKLGKIYDCVNTNNVIASNNASQKALSIKNYIGPTLKIGTLDNNTYINTKSTTPIYFETKQVPENSKLHLTFEHWRNLYRQDENSTVIDASTLWAKNTLSEILVNDSKQDKTFNFPKDQYFLINGEKVDEPIVLKPFTSVILLKKQ